MAGNNFEDCSIEQKYDPYDPRSELKRVCVLYTGGMIPLFLLELHDFYKSTNFQNFVAGTIGMKKSPDGYIPVAGYMESRLLQDPQFHDAQFTAPTTAKGNRCASESHPSLANAKHDNAMVLLRLVLSFFLSSDFFARPSVGLENGRSTKSSNTPT